MTSAANQKILNDAFKWLSEQVETHPFGEFTLSLTTHSSRIGRIQKSLTEKILSGGGNESTK
jgi:hypothetical protein